MKPTLLFRSLPLIAVLFAFLPALAQATPFSRVEIDPLEMEIDFPAAELKLIGEQKAYLMCHGTTGWLVPYTSLDSTPLSAEFNLDSKPRADGNSSLLIRLLERAEMKNPSPITHRGRICRATFELHFKSLKTSREMRVYLHADEEWFSKNVTKRMHAAYDGMSLSLEMEHTGTMAGDPTIRYCSERIFGNGGRSGEEQFKIELGRDHGHIDCP